MMPPQCCGPSVLPGSAVKSGSSARAKLILAPLPRLCLLCDLRADRLGHRRFRRQPQQGRLRIGVGEHDVGGDLVAVLEHHAGGAAMPAAGSPAPWRRAGSRRPRPGPPCASASVIAAHAAVRDRPAAEPAAKLGRGVIELGERRARRPRARRRAGHAAVGHRPFDVVGGEEALEIAADAREQRAVQHVGPVRAGERGRELRQRRLRLEHEAVQHPGDAAGICLVTRVGLGVRGRDARDALHGPLGIGIEEDVPAVGNGTKTSGSRR